MNIPNALLIAISLSAYSLVAQVRINSVTVVETGEFRIEYSSESGVYYRLEGSAELSGPYSVVGMELGSGQTNGLFTDGIGDAAGFYRLQELPLTSMEDWDRDGLPDAFELQRAPSLNPLDSADAVRDPDGDGLSTIEEYEQGWDPLRIESPSLAARSRLPGGPPLVSVRFSTGIAASSLPSGGGGIESGGSTNLAKQGGGPVTPQIPNLVRILPEVTINDLGVMAFIAETRREDGATNSNIYVTRQTDDGAWQTVPVMTDGQSADTHLLGPGAIINNAGQIAVRRAVLDRTGGINIVTSYAEIWDGNVFGGQNRGNYETIAVGSTLFSEFTTIRNQVVLNNAGTMAFFALNRSTRYIVVAGSRGFIKNEISTAVVETPLSLSDVDTIVLRRGDSSGRIVMLTAPDFRTKPVIEVANPSLGFVSLGRAPGISDDGRLIVFYADYIGPTNALLDAHGPGIFAVLHTNAITADNFSQATMIRVAGKAGNGHLDPGETWNDANTNRIVELGEDEGVITGFDPDSAVRANNDGYIVWTATARLLGSQAQRPNTQAWPARHSPGLPQAVVMGVRLRDRLVPAFGPQCVAEQADQPVDGVPFENFIFTEPLSNGQAPRIGASTHGRSNGNEVLAMILLPLDIAVDTDRDGTVNSVSDQRDEDLWTNQRGAIYNVNFDRDGDNTISSENRPDAIHFNDSGTATDEDYQIENAADEEDIAPLVIKPLQALPADYKVILKVEEEEDFRAIHLFKRIHPGEDAIWGSHKDPADAPWAAHDDDPADLEIDISKLINPNVFGYEETRIDPGNDDYTLGIEGLVLRGMDVSGGSLEDETSNPLHAGKFSGEIAITLEIRDSAEAVVGSQTVRLRVAPWLAITSDQNSEEVWTADLGAENAAFRSEPLNGRYAGLNHSGQLHTVASDERWFQDHLEIGFTQRPGGPKTHMVFRVPYDRGPGSVQPAWPIERLLKADVGIFQLGIDGEGSGPHGSSGSYGGNLEVLTSNESNPLGLIMMGNNASGKMRAFIEAQEFQHSDSGSFSARTDWLIVGHIDEYTSFLSGGRVLISGARQAIELLESEIPTADRAKRVFFAKSGNTLTGTVTTETAAIDDPATPLDERRLIHTGRNHVIEGDIYKWIRFYAGNSKGHVARVTLHDGFLEVDDEVLGAPSIWFLGSSLEDYQHQSERGALEGRWRSAPASGDEFVLCEEVKRWSPFRQDLDIDGDRVPDAFDVAVAGFPALITVKEVLEDSGADNFVQFNKFDVQGVINDDGESPIRTAAGLDAPRFIPVPNLFFGRDLPSGMDVESPNPVSGQGGSVAFNPGPTNLQPIGGKLYVPRQFGPVDASGQDVYEKVIQNAVADTVFFVDCWDAYHRALGEVHCGSSVKRTLPSWNWWEKINP